MKGQLSKWTSTKASETPQVGTRSIDEIGYPNVTRILELLIIWAKNENYL